MKKCRIIQYQYYGVKKLQLGRRGGTPGLEGWVTLFKGEKVGLGKGDPSIPPVLNTEWYGHMGMNTVPKKFF